MLQQGDGDKPTLGAKVKVNYTGWLTDGTMFDSSRSNPVEFTLGQVIEGWNEGVQLMSPGSRFKFTIPPALGYGERGSPPKIPANATLVFEVELISFAPARLPTPQFVKPNPDKQKTTESGLKYEVVKEGSGDNATPSQHLRLEFAFWNTKGKLLQTSAHMDLPVEGKPEGFSIKVLQEALALMKPGARYRFEVPAALAFGAREMGPDLPPNSVTIWDVELLEFVNAPEFAMPKDDELKKTDSGLQYQVIREGKGESPTLSDRVVVHYSGWLTDGTPFDASFKRGQPATFGVGQVIKGWQEGLQLMKPGAIYKFVIPSELAYGERGSPPTIGPNQTLVFWVNLLK